MIGVGNRDRGDDAAGLLAAAFLRRRLPPGVAVSAGRPDPVSLFELWEGAERVWLIDAVMSGAPEGTVHRVDVAAQPLLPHPRSRSTHSLGLADGVELARTLGRLPQALIVFGVEAARFPLGGWPSAEVRAGARQAAHAVAGEVAAALAVT